MPGVLSATNLIPVRDFVVQFIVFRGQKQQGTAIEFLVPVDETGHALHEELVQVDDSDLKGDRPLLQPVTCVENPFDQCLS